MKKLLYIIDTSAILSGKPLSFPDGDMITTPEIAQEFTPGGRDHRTFQLLREKGLILKQASKNGCTEIQKKAIDIGEKKRLSQTDISLLALAYDLIQKKENQILILTDDYAIQNMAAHMHIPYTTVSQRGITKKFKWTTRCPGCGKHYKDAQSICPICGSKHDFHLINKNQ
jgi:UPF0271 protein